MIIRWDANDNLYWDLERGSFPVLASKEERAMLKEELTKLLKKLK